MLFFRILSWLFLVVSAALAARNYDVLLHVLDDALAGGSGGGSLPAPPAAVPLAAGIVVLLLLRARRVLGRD